MCLCSWMRVHVCTLPHLFPLASTHGEKDIGWDRAPTGVCAQVAREGIPAAAGVVAEVALEGFLAGVQLDVAQQVALLGEGGPALVALERPLPWDSTGECENGARARGRPAELAVSHGAADLHRLQV